MKTRIRTALALSSAILLAALFALSLLVGRQGYQGLMLITPSASTTPGLNPKSLEELSEDGFLLTYEIRKASSVRATSSGHSVTLVGTNQSYANIMGYPVVDGGFFTKAAWEAKNRHAVLNRTAAYRIFGSERISGQLLKLDGESWVVAGVIQDYDEENANIYAPAGVTGGQAGSVMALTGGSFTGDYLKNALKSVGVRDGTYRFISLSELSGAFALRFSVALAAAMLAAILLLAFRIWGALAESLRYYRERMRDIYLRELFDCHGADIARTLFGAALLAAGIAAMIWLSSGVLESCLAMSELEPITGELTAGDFGGRLRWLKKWHYIDVAVFAAYLCTLALNLILALERAGKRVTSGRAADAAWEPDRRVYRVNRGEVGCRDAANNSGG